MYDQELIDFCVENNINYSQLDSGKYEKYTDMKNFPFTGSRIAWSKLKVHCKEDIKEVLNFTDKIISILKASGSVQLILVGYDFEYGYCLNLDSLADHLKLVLDFLVDYPGENYLIASDESWCICVYDYLDFGLSPSAD